MDNSLVNSLSLIDTSGVVIISVIVAMLCTGLALTVLIRARYGSIARELVRQGNTPEDFASPLLRAVVRDTLHALQNGAGEPNTQGIVEQAVQLELRGLMIGERFVRSMTGLVIILGLVGTFYGLSSSIGRLTSLLAGKVPEGADVTASLTAGLTETLSGMSVAFSASLFGIVSAIVLTLLGVFLNIGDRRLEVMVRIENYLDNVLLADAHGAHRGSVAGGAGGARTAFSGQGTNQQLEGMLLGFGESVQRLEGAVVGFEKSLAGFSANTRDFREFNVHLKDNIQRMSLSFGDLSDSLKQQAGAINASLRARDRS